MALQIRESLITVEEFEELADWLRGTGRQYELVEGKIVKKMPSKDWHTHIINLIVAYIQMHLVTHNLPGITTSQITGFRFNDYHCPEPDIAYCHSMSGYANQHCITGYWPDLVVEVVSNPDNAEEIRRLETDRPIWIERGAMVWEVWPQAGCAKIFSDRGEPRIERDTLTFESLPGLEIPLKVVFAKLSQE
ncbi:MAG: Uma2 family endonuclease [Anaerolineae bacterium]|nr:Uma2 family endonuclease [Anaerolineae bacterium]